MADKAELVKKDEGSEKLVKVKCLRPFMKREGVMANVGDVVDVTEAMAKDLCTPIFGAHSFFGERINAATERHNLTRAQLVA